MNFYNPDVLSCLANLSNDEVFTPGNIANDMLDLLPKELWSNPETTFLDPCCKTGIFLREIVKRLDVGLQNIIPNRVERINHILKYQVFGIAITELTSLITRRSLYCSKQANGKYSACDIFDSFEGNIHFQEMKHTWSFGSCIYCGANKNNFDRPEELETHAYEFIHKSKVEEIFKMKFDVIIGNPPYQLNDGGGTGASAIPLYHKFVEQAIKMNPRYLTMIIPSRWFSGGKGLDEFRSNILSDTRLRELYDFPISTECFPGVSIKGGVCYFLWNRDNRGECKITTIQGDNKSTMVRPLLEEGADVFIRYNEAISIYRKIHALKEPSFVERISTRKPFGFASTFTNYSSRKFNDKDIKIYANKSVGYLPQNYKIPQNEEWIDKYKIFITTAYGAGDEFPHQIINKPFIGEPHSCSTETYIVLGTYEDKETAENVLSYVKTKFFRFLVLFKKNTQNGARNVYSFVPDQDFSHPWNDNMLYEKYKLTQEEKDFIESMIRPMDETSE